MELNARDMSLLLAGLKAVSENNRVEIIVWRN